MAESQTTPVEHAAAPAIVLTPAAQAMARKFLAQEADPSDKVFRVGVDAGGCSGFSYAISIDVKKNDDLVYSYEGFECVVAPNAVPLIKDSLIDYEDSIGHAGFRFENPQAQSNCGCGTSFDIA